MLEADNKIALYMEGALGDPHGKMGYGCLRYSPHEIVCVIDSNRVGQDILSVTGIERACPIVGSVDEARALGADVLVLGIAPSGGLIPEEWWPAIDRAIELGLSIVNGLHDLLSPRYKELKQGQWIWDVRIEPPGLTVGSAQASTLSNRRVLLIGTDMNIGKMTAGLEMHSLALKKGMSSAFVATGQIGITITGAGVPLDAVRVDYASGAIEQEVMRYPDKELVIVEGQGSLIHPGSTANLPLIRGSCPTHLVLCHKAGQGALAKLPSIKIPPLSNFCALYEDLAEACNTFPRPKTVAVALNTKELTDEQADEWTKRISRETGLPCADPVRHGAKALLDAILSQ